MNAKQHNARADIREKLLREVSKKAKAARAATLTAKR